MMWMETIERSKRSRWLKRLKVFGWPTIHDGSVHEGSDDPTSTVFDTVHVILKQGTQKRVSSSIHH